MNVTILTPGLVNSWISSITAAVNDIDRYIEYYNCDMTREEIQRKELIAKQLTNAIVELEAAKTNLL